MMLTMPEVRALSSLSVMVRGRMPSGARALGKVAAMAALRQAGLEKLVAAAGFSEMALNARDLILAPSGDPDAWWASWAPFQTVTELDGGPKDGVRLVLPSLRSVLEFRQLSPSWMVAAAAGFPLPKISYFYELAGYEAFRGIYVHRYSEG